MTALIALLDVTAKRGGPAEFDRGHDAPLRCAQRRAMLRTIGVAVAAEHVRHFRPRPGHRRRGSEVLARGGRRCDGRRTQQLQGAHRGADLAGGDPQIAGCGRQAAVTKQQLNGANVGAGLQQMDREGMPQAMRRDELRQSGETKRFLAGLAHGAAGDRLAGTIAREEPLPWPHRPPIAAQDLQQRGREHHVAVLRKRQAEAVQPIVLKFQGISASMSLFGQRLAMRSRVSIAQA